MPVAKSTDDMYWRKLCFSLSMASLRGILSNRNDLVFRKCFFPVIEHVLFLVQMFTTIARLLLDYCTTIHCCVDMTVVNSFQPMETLNTGTVHIV